MAVVITPAENRLAMAKRPPNKLDAEVAERVNEERKRGWNSEWAYDRRPDYSETYSFHVLDGLLAIPYAFSMARFWRTKTQQTQALKK
jgi:hypothetical protein